MKLRINLDPLPKRPDYTGAGAGAGTGTSVTACERCGQPMCATDGRGPTLVSKHVIYRTTLCVHCNQALSPG